MSSFDQAADRINAAVEKAEIGSEILSQVANGDEFTEVPTTSGPVPSLKKWQKDNMDLISGGVIARVDKAILSYPDYAAASAAAATLPDGQVVDINEGELRFTVSGGNLTDERPQTAYMERSIQEKAADIYSIKDADANVSGDGVSDSTNAFITAEQEADEIYLPAGVYVANGVVLSKKYYGPGVIKLNGVRFEKASAAQDLFANTLVGRFAGGTLSGGIANTLIGENAGRAITTGSRNVYVGTNGGSGNAAKPELPPFTGSDNIGIGHHALKKIQSGGANIGIGMDAGNEITTGNGNTCIGASAGQQITIGSDNTVVGRGAALRLGTNSNAAGTPTDPATWVGVGGTGNTIFGRDALRNGFNCDGNTVVGYQAMRGTKDESDLTGNITGANNVVVGRQAASNNPTSLAGNVIIGYEAGKSISTGTNNVIIGTQAARDFEGSGNIVIGPTAVRSATSLNNKLILSNITGTAFIDGDMVGAQNAANILTIDALIRPASDATRTNGTALRRWDVVFARDGAISTSDGREKTEPLPIDDAVLDAWGEVQLIAFQWLEAVANKGGEVARWHFGVIAQQVCDAFNARGLDGTRYGLLCYDEWQEAPEVLDEDGNVVVPAQHAGNRWGIRADQCLFLEAAYQRRRADRIESRLTAIEAQMQTLS